MKKKLEKLMNKNKKNTYYAKVDIVSDSSNIAYYSLERKDYTELALTAIQNNPKAIKYVSPLCKDYSFLCEEALNGSIDAFSSIDYRVSNYKELAIRSIIIEPRMVLCVNKNSRYYHFLWKFALAHCFKLLENIDEQRSELFPLIATVLDSEPLAIAFVNSGISVYNNLCKFAYSKDIKSANYMDIDAVDDNLAFKIIKQAPEKIKYLSPLKSFYKDALNLALSIDTELIHKVALQSENTNEKNRTLNKSCKDLSYYGCPVKTKTRVI